MPWKFDCIRGSSSLIAQSETRWPCKETYASLIIPNLNTSEPLSSPLLALVPIPPHPHLVPGEDRIGEKEMAEGMIPAINGIEEPAKSPIASAALHTAVIEEDVGEPIESRSVQTREFLNESIARGQRFRRKGVWSPGVSGCSRTTLWTETAAPLPRPPAREFLNHDALNTIQSHPSLFKVSTPIKVDVFESLLADHPNPDFVNSVCVGLREGFWPFADTHAEEWPLIFDNSDRPPKTEAEREFLRAQIEKEIEVGRYSQAFGPDLLPGMYSMPIHAVPKPGTNKHQLVTDHSAGKYALNSMISPEDIAGVTLDNIHDLANGLRSFRHSRPHAKLILWKADVSEAYRHMPMHPLWQIKQIVSFQGRQYVDRRNVFGGRASQRIYHAFMSLVIWIAIFKILIHFLYIYVDDSFSFEDKRDLELYAPYKKVLPRNMVKLLRLWDAIGLPHEERKQIFGSELPIIELASFAQKGSRRSLRDFQRLAGWLNWALNVYPLLRPGLSALYAKTAGKLVSRALLWVNRDVVRELNWVINHLRDVEGVFFFKSVSWSFSHLPPDVLTVYTDASGDGLAYWFPDLNIGFQSPLPSSAPIGTIFYFEALAVTAAILDAISRLHPAYHRIAVFSDNINTVSMFNSLAALPPYNWLLMESMDAIISAHVDFRVFFVAGVENVVADHLSRWRNSAAETFSPGLSIHPFTPPHNPLLPPRNTLGASKK
ncbi:hypothetical protein CY34DRAFT_12163 [Suillus luteus UH-Slu-Lm8-n1]|uniref:Reverse transcriptase n=1 Tax=Suillus luteus UH-Slu-Lm8-n1 TaxID=930992 RepID=A0A0D0ALP3_9AGAM|nr:hypothetical protein CY34DRAFT_12163 [Suillus luteus UH-Slu-Lm8-n1]